MNAKQIFPDESERCQVKQWLDLFKGEITKVWSSDGKVLFESNKSYDNQKYT